MISVFGGLVLGDDPAIKTFGLGLATAIFIDATIGRMILVPATMKLMGDAKWWIPGWLDRLRPRIDSDGGAERPVAALAGAGPVTADEDQPLLV
jgi:RND superfamily putative drug exporter